MDIIGKINALKILLAQTDYQALKHADGAMPDEEYEQIRKKRAEWRRQINELEAEEADGAPAFAWVADAETQNGGEPIA